MIRRIFQVEIATSEDEENLQPSECHVAIRNPRTGRIVANLSFEEADRWLAE